MLKRIGVVAIFCAITGALACWMIQVNERAIAQSTAYELFQLHLAFSNYDDNFGHLPLPNALSSDGVPLASWRYAIVPFVGDQKIEFAPDEAWDNDKNSQWRARVNPLSGGRDARVFALVDRDNAFDVAGPNRLTDLPGWLWLVIRVSGSEHHWMKPGDLSLEDLHEILAGNPAHFGIKLGEPFFALSADGTVLQIAANVPWEIVRPYLSIADSPPPQDGIAPFIIARATPESKQLRRG